MAALVAGLLTLAGASPEPSRPPSGALDPWLADLRDELAPAAPAPGAAPVYRLHWTLEEEGRTLVARQETRLRNVDGEPWDRLYFHLLPNLLGGAMEVDELWVRGVPRTPALEAEGRLLRVDLTRPLAAGEEITVTLRYRLRLPAAGGRNYGILGHRDGALSLAHAYALLAVRDEAGWALDEPAPYGDLVHARASYFLVDLVAPPELRVASSGVVLERRQAGDRQELRIAAGPVRDFYLWAAPGVVGVERRAGEVLLRGYAPAAQAAAMATVLDQAAAALRVFEAWLGPYPHGEFEVVPIPTDALGVEFPGIIALRGRLLAPGADAGLRESTTVHEVGHQWFYALVGNDQLAEPWLDESLTQYATLRYYLERYGREGYEGFRRGLVARWDAVGRERLPVGLPVAAYSQGEYGAIVYGLGPLEFERLAEHIGVGVFDRALADYVERLAFGLARPEDLEQAFERHCGCELDGFFEDWAGP